MADMAPKLWCLIEGGTTPFSVPASDVSIDELKEMIKRRNQNNSLLQRVDALNLILWKPREVISVRPSNTLAQRIRDLGPGFSQFEQLDPTYTVSDVFPPQIPSSPRLDVLVQIPASTSQDEYPSKRQHSGDISIFSWLEEVRAKVWGRDALEPELFRTVEVTQAHYDELQRRLKEKHPDRDSPEYDGSNHDVQSVKLDVLRLNFPENPPRRPNNNEDRVDDDDAPEASDDDESGMDVDEPEASNDGGSTNDTIFPFTLRFLDLSTLGLRADVSHRLPLPLFVRQEYHDISRLISRYGSVIVSGQPGTGKTAYLHLRVIESMIKGHPFLYQDTFSIVYHINERGVRPIQSWSSGDIVAFVDGDRKNSKPNPILLSNKSVKIILASSPKGANEKWSFKARNFFKIVTEPWSPDELFVTGIFLHPFDISPELLKDSTVYFGYNPRRCFDSATSVKQLVHQKVSIQSRITGVASNQGNILQVLHASRRGDNDVSHSIFEISPMDTSRFLYQCKFSYVSRWALDYFLSVCETQQAAAAAAFYRIISGETDAASLWGCVFERLVFKDLVGIGGERKFPMCGLSEPIRGQTTWTFRGPIPRSDFRTEEEFNHATTNAVENENPLHLVPLSRNFAAVDSIVYDPNEEVLTCIQITVSSEHDINVSGLRRIQSWLKRDTPLAKLRPSSRRPWRVIFIVPPSVEASFELQALKGDTSRGRWARKMHQYVLGLDVFRKPESSV